MPSAALREEYVLSKTTGAFLEPWLPLCHEVPLLTPLVHVAVSADRTRLLQQSVIVLSLFVVVLVGFVESFLIFEIISELECAAFLQGKTGGITVPHSPG